MIDKLRADFCNFVGRTLVATYDGELLDREAYDERYGDKPVRTSSTSVHAKPQLFAWGFVSPTSEKMNHHC